MPPLFAMSSFKRRNMNMAIHKAHKWVEKQVEGGLHYKAVFVPFSESRHASSDWKSINWKVTLSKGSHSLTTDYGQGIAHLPGYYEIPIHLRNKIIIDDEVSRAVESGKWRRWVNSNGGYFGREAKIPAPTLTDVLAALLMESDVLDCTGFESWCENNGFHSDSRSVERIYEQCLKNSLALQHLIDLKKARKAFENY